MENLSKYVYGTTRLGDESIPLKDRVKIAREAMDAGVWFHTSTQYGNALEVLGKAFDEDRASVPKMFFKIGGSTIEEIRQSIADNLAPIAVDSMNVGQLCISGQLADEFATGGQCYADFQELKKEGLVHNFVMEVFPWTSKLPFDALTAGHTDKIVDAFIFYLNPLQRFAANNLWDLIQKKGANIVAMRTVSGGPVHRLRDEPGFAWQKYLQERAVEVAPIFERSGVEDWTEFCVRFAHSIPGVLTTVGSSSRHENLQKFLNAIDGEIAPLASDIVDELFALQTRWSDELDIKAEPWSM